MNIILKYLGISDIIDINYGVFKFAKYKFEDQESRSSKITVILANTGLSKYIEVHSFDRHIMSIVETDVIK